MGAALPMEEISDIDRAGLYLVALRGRRLALCVTHGRDNALWGETTTYEVEEMYDPDRGTFTRFRLLDIPAEDDDYVFWPIDKFEGRVIYDALEYGMNTYDGIEPWAT